MEKQEKFIVYFQTTIEAKDIFEAEEKMNMLREKYSLEDSNWESTVRGTYL